MCFTDVCTDVIILKIVTLQSSMEILFSMNYPQAPHIE